MTIGTTFTQTSSCSSAMRVGEMVVVARANTERVHGSPKPTSEAPVIIQMPSRSSHGIMLNCRVALPAGFMPFGRVR
ncbi:hypothetical protein WG66_001642 [Moniliophthora roreri]|nr:hypothetical protein WG66_001642 [Moniliophthora roreri]